MAILDQHKNEINNLCAQYKVSKLYAFGSVLTDTFNESSDVDLVVNFSPIDVLLYADNYFDLKFSLQAIINRRVDLLEENAIKNPYLRDNINKQRKLIYENSN